jgi:uncharacterized protein YjiS (DUF1127 family)
MEGAMSTISQEFTTFDSRRRLRWTQVKQHLVEWRHRARSRKELMTLTDRCLQDIGISRCTVDFEACKPFWMP